MGMTDGILTKRTMSNNSVDLSWDYAKENTKEYTHGLHSYPARMVPQIVRRLLDLYGKHGGSLLDPYCGTGTSLVEASIYGMRSTGCDINPLARLISSAKTASISADMLAHAVKEFSDIRYLSESEVDMPTVLNLDYWFSENVTERLGKIRCRILDVEDTDIKNFLWTTFSDTVRRCSFSRNEEIKPRKMPQERLDRHDPNVLDMFVARLFHNAERVFEYLLCRENVDVLISDADTVKGQIPEADAKYNMCITSPPYGDSATTVAYGQYSRFSSEWIGLPSAREVDKMCMGGTKQNGRLPESPVSSAVREIEIQDPSRAKEVVSYYLDLSRSIDCVASMMSDESVVVYVIGNRTVKNVWLPTDEFVKKEFMKHGFSHTVTYVRNIPKKRMPKIVSPSNIAGETTQTMHNEHIVVCEKK